MGQRPFSTTRFILGDRVFDEQAFDQDGNSRSFFGTPVGDALIVFAFRVACAELLGGSAVAVKEPIVAVIIERPDLRQSFGFNTIFFSHSSPIDLVPAHSFAFI
ncbi:MAG: hypothetical protein EOP89_04845 [Lysobacteraceae bacterium]|nr:MAG: hypothetical protein EOP89_04845 [Xanthomonadaceae bacterium]